MTGVAGTAAQAAAAIVRYALPPRCPGCGSVVAEDDRFCLPCWSSLDFLAGPSCRICAEPFEETGAAGLTCAACLADPPAFDRVHAAVLYGEVARKVAVSLKHGNRPGQARTIAAAMARLLDSVPPDALVVPVPLHRWRLWRRGYNQSALIGRALARRARLGFAVDLLERRKRTPLLRGLGRKAREKAVSGAFALRPGARDELRGRPIVLVDDVFTSGATARGCAKVLKRGGAARVDVMCWARVGREGDGAGVIG